jgi:TolA-binding protein
MGAIFGFLSALMGIKTALSIAAGIGLIAVFLTGQHMGNKGCTAAFELALAKAQIVELQRQKAALENTVQLQEEIEERHVQESKEDEELIRQLDEIIDKRPASSGVCLSTDELRALDRIR